MGVYTADRTMLSEAANIPADLKYCHESNIGLMLVEAQQNDLSIFDAVIRSDISSALRIKEGSLLESEISTLTEGVVTNIKNRIVELLKKFFAKVRALFDAFIAKLTSVIAIDGKKFIKMNEKRVNTAHLNEIKVDYRKPKYKFGECAAKVSTYYDDFMHPAKYMNLTDDQIKDRNENANDADDGIAATMYGKAIESGPVSRKEFNSEIVDYCFGSEEEVTVGSIFSEIKDSIINGRKNLDAMKKTKNTLLKAIDKQITAYNKLVKETNKTGNHKDTDAELAKEMSTLASAYNLAAHELNCAHSAVSNIIAGLMKCSKMEVSQARRCYAKACTSPKKEDAELSDMIAEAAEFDVEQEFESFRVPDVYDED